MLPTPAGSSLRRPLLRGALLLACLFVAAGAALSSLAVERHAEQERRERLLANETHARDRALVTAQELAVATRVCLEDARRVAELVAAEAARATAEPTAVASPAPFVPVPGGPLRWRVDLERDTFAVATRPEHELALLRWQARLASVLRGAVAAAPGLVRVTLTIDDVGAAGAPASWAASASSDAAATSALHREIRGTFAPDASQWVEDEHARFVFGVPVRDAGRRRVGTVWAELGTPAVSGRLAGVAPAGTGVALLSSAGKVVAADASFTETTGAMRWHAPGSDPLRVALQPLLGGDGVFHPQAPGRHIVQDGLRFSAAAVAGTPFSVAAVRRVAPVANAAAAPDLPFGHAPFVLGVAAATLTLLGAWILARLHAARVAPLVNAVRDHARGAYGHTVETDADDDLGELARWLNAAAVRVRQSIARADENERRLAMLMETSGDGFVTTDADDRILHVNPRFAELVRRPAQNLVGHYVEELLLPESLERYRSHVGRQREGKSARLEVVWNSSRPPHTRTVVAGVPLFDDRGRYCGSYVVVTDLTDKVRVHDEMARAEKLRALAEMAGGVAHDFNNVLTVILGNAQYLLLEELSPDAKDTLKVIERTALEGTETIRRIREFTRTRSVPVNAEPVDVDELVGEVMAGARSRLEAASKASNKQFRVVVERSARRRVRGMRAELLEALANVVENALDAMPQGGTLTVESLDRGEDSVAIRVEDTGVGMTPEQMRKIYDPFFTTKEGGRCPGLGLSIAYGIIRAHRGRIDVRSDPGQGSTFTLVLPAATAAEPPQTAGSAPDVQPRLLLVGGEPAQTSRLIEDLRELGVCGASVPAATALALVSDPGIFNMLVVEQDLGATTGWDVARQARAARPDLRIVLVSVPGAGVNESQARNAGIDRVLVRPFDARDLHAEVFALLGAPREPHEKPVPASVRMRAPLAPKLREEEEVSMTSELWAEGSVRPLEPPEKPRKVGDTDSSSQEIVAGLAATQVAEPPADAGTPPAGGNEG